MTQHLREIETLEQFLELDGEIHDAIVQDVDFSTTSVDWTDYSFRDTVFLGTPHSATDYADRESPLGHPVGAWSKRARPLPGTQKDLEVEEGHDRRRLRFTKP